MHLAHDPGQHRAIAHAGVEHANGRRLGMQVGELHADAPRNHLLLAAGVDEQQILLPVVEEAEIARRSLLGAALGLGRATALARAATASARGGLAGAATPRVVRKALTRSRVSGVMRAPSRRRATNLPSLTARRPKVDSAMPARRQNSEMLSSSPTAA